MSLPSIPSSIAQYIQQAAKGTGLPESVVAAQNYVESGYGTNDGPSSAGAMGPWQFEPGTWAGVTNAPFSQASDWTVSTPAYIKLMNQLLNQEKGNVRNALAAYNAGPGNLQAGYGYADEILSLANQSGNLTDTTGGSSSPAGISVPGLGGITGPLSTIASVFTTLDTVLKDILKPSFWLRIVSFFAGIFLLSAGIWCLIRASDNSPLLPQNVPMIVPI